MRAGEPAAQKSGSTHVCLNQAFELNPCRVVHLQPYQAPRVQPWISHGAMPKEPPSPVQHATLGDVYIVYQIN